MGFGARLKEILAQKGKSIIWLSEQTGIPRNSLYTITKRDNTTPRLETIKKIAQALDVPITFLILEDNVLNEYIDEQANSHYTNHISNINSSNNVVQGSGFVTVNDSSNNKSKDLTKEETEILNIYRSLNIRDKARFLNMILEIDEKKTN